MKLNAIEFRNEFTQTFPGDNSGDLSPRQTPKSFYSKAHPTPVKNPKLISWNEKLAEEMGLEQPEKNDLNILAGNLVTPSMRPYAACYGGHQFGNWAGQLGDGRAITLGEIKTAEKTWELQLKGAGPTAYSRSADGRAVLRSSVREYLVSEAMYYLGVPTTRALSLVTTGENVLRDMFYNGNPAYEPGAIVSRVAPSFLRFGNFEILAACNEKENLQQLTDWTIDKYYPTIKGENKILNFFDEVVKKTAELMVEWHRVGFVHGVMNTDNMSILGLTIDYGPFSFMDNYDPSFTPNTTDLPGRRYAFGKQASIGYWNLGCLANALAPLFKETAALVQALEAYEDIYYSCYYAMMCKKLGLDELRENDKDLIHHFENVLSEIQPDMTIFYRLLIDLPLIFEDEKTLIEYFEKCFYVDPDETQISLLYSLILSYQERLKQNEIPHEESQKMIKNNNPYFILRNYLLFQAIEGLEKGENYLFLKLEKALKDPYAETSKEFFQKRPDWASKTAGCSMLSCSS
ncbi:MAG TPA: YdiU family protein [Salinimicrobium sp.]|nr:YdiU family protein [Salinimicrobium sp.]